LVYAGEVDHGFEPSSTAALQKRLKPLIRKTQPYAKKIAHPGIGSSRRCWLRSNTAPSPPRAKSAIHFFKRIREDL
jgi:bifunctional non-homologous end joining protein LigD